MQMSIGGTINRYFWSLYLSQVNSDLVDFRQSVLFRSLTLNAFSPYIHSCRRKENLQARIKAKQQKKVDVREKRLMRAGFEGRRDTFINEWGQV